MKPLRLNSLGITSIIVLSTALYAALALLLAGGVTFGLLESYFTDLLRLTFRDSALFPANTYVIARHNGLDAQAALAATNKSIQEFLPGATAIITDKANVIVAADAGCGVTSAALKPRSPSSLRTIFLGGTTEPNVVNPCRADILAVATTEVPTREGTYRLTLFAPPVYSQLLFSRRGLGLIALYCSPALLVALLTIVGLLLVLRMVFERHASSLLHQIREYLPGTREVRLAPGALQELNDVSDGFNELVREEAARRERLAAEDELRVRTLQQLVHDLKTPLAAIDGALDRLQHTAEGAGTAVYREVISTAMEGQNRAATLLEQLSSLPPSSLELQLTDVDLGAVLHRQWRQLQVEASTKAIAFPEPTLDTDSGRLQADAPLLDRAIQNVLANALRYTPTGGAVSINVDPSPHHLTLVITNTGPTLSPEELSRLTERFYRGTNAIGVEGSGLGLSIVREVVDLHGGTVEISSDISRGTSVLLRLPRVVSGSIGTAASAPRDDNRNEACEASEPTTLLSITVIAALLSIGSVAASLSSHSSVSAVIISLVLLTWGFWNALHLYGSNSPGRSSSAERALGGILVLICLLSVVEPEGIASGVATAAAISVGLAWSALAVVRRRAGAAMLPVCALLVFLASITFHQAHGIGIVAAGLLGIPGLLLDVFARRREIAPLTMRYVLLFGILSTIISSVGIFFLVPALSRVALDAGVESLTEAIAHNAATQTGERSSFEALLAVAHEVNPLYDLLSFHRDGTYLADAAMDYADAVRLDTAQIGAGGTMAGRPLNSAFSRKSLVRVTPFHFGGEDALLAVQFPSFLTDHLASRTMQYFAARFFVLLLVVQCPVLLALFFYARRLIAERIHRVRSGLSRYLAGDYTDPIALSTKDTLGKLAVELDTVAGRIRAVNSAISVGTRSLKATCATCAQELRLLETRLVPLLTQLSEPVLSGSIIDDVRSDIGDYRARIESILPSSRNVMPKGEPISHESFSLGEILDEESENIHSEAANRGVSVVRPSIAASWIVEGNPEQCAQLLRALFRETLSGLDTGGELTIKLRSEGGCLVVECSGAGGPTTPAVCEMNEIGLGAVPDVWEVQRRHDRRGYRIAFPARTPMTSPHRLTLSSLLTLFIVSCSASAASATDLPVCLGYSSESGSWGQEHLLTPATPEVHCDRGMAYLLLFMPPGWQVEPDQVFPLGTCCPLPDGSLTEESVYVSGACPADSVVTGGRLQPGFKSLEQFSKRLARFELRCTRIRRDRFQLLAPQAARPLDSIAPFSTFIEGHWTPFLSRRELPVELRFGLGRTSRTRWSGGCVGTPAGAVLTGVATDCGKMRFQELRPLSGEPLQTPCSAISDPFQPNPSCIRLER